jgi:acyl-homoserine lactone acylase PvdQ
VTARRRLLFLAFTAATALTLFPAAASARARGDFATRAYDILPPGQAGDIPVTRHSTDQIRPYDRLAAKRGPLHWRDLRRYFKPDRFGLAGTRRESVERLPRPRARIVRDRWGVPHVYSRTRTGVMFAAGWVAAEDRGTLMEALRGPGYVAALDVPGLDPQKLATGLRRFDPSAQTRKFIRRQLLVVRHQGRRGERVLADIRAYVEGINAYNRDAGRPVKRWTSDDVAAIASLIGAIFGRGGGDEARRSQLLWALQQRLGLGLGQQVWDDLRELQDPETSVTVARPVFPYGAIEAQHPGNAIVESLTASAARASTAAATAARRASNALLLGRGRSTSRHPLFVAGPQVGYFYPEVFHEVDLHGGGIDVRGVSVGGAAPYVLIGRGKDFAWSATSASSDLIDQYVEELCGNDTTYRYKGSCRPMTTFAAGTLGAGGGEPARAISFRETVHGPVIGYATVGGRRVAIASKRSTRGRELSSGVAFAALNANRVRRARDFLHTMSRVEFTFNWFYADSKDIAVFSSGRLPVRPAGVDPGLPTLGTGAYEWRGFLSRRKHPQTISPTSGQIINWNNKPARGFAAADNNWSYGAVHRNQLLEDAVARRHKHSLPSLVAAMNRAATQDLRAAKVLTPIQALLVGWPAPSPRAKRMFDLLLQWRAQGSSRIDRDLDGKIDDPGAAIMDAAWPKIANAVMGPVLGPQLDDLARLMPRDEAARPLGSSYGGGWYGYVDKAIRAVFPPVTSCPSGGCPPRVDVPFRTQFCGLGSIDACRASIWGALDAAGSDLAAAQGPNPAAWRTDATKERIKFEPGLLPQTMRWTNRPTFQQAIYFKSGRARD